MEIYKYEMNGNDVKYLLNAVEIQQHRGEQEARDMIAMKEFLIAGLKNGQVVNIEQKSEPVTKEKKKK